MQCPKCGHNNSKGSLYCSLCHEVFETKSNPHHESVEETRYKMMFKHRDRGVDWWKRWIALDVWLSLVVITVLAFWVYNIWKETKIEDVKKPAKIISMGRAASFFNKFKYQTPPAGSQHYQTIHFDIYCVDKTLADEISSQVERYCEISADLGLVEANFWKKKRVLIYIYETQQEFRKATGVSDLCSGYADLNRRIIYSYDDIDHLTEAVIPHELTHLIFADFMEQSQNYPKWLTEGLATYEEAKYCKAYISNYQKILDNIREGKYLGMIKLTEIDINGIKNLNDLQSWYVESLSIVSYLLDVHGRGKFYTFCKELRDGCGLEEALKRAYSPNFNSLPELTGYWLNYIKNNRHVWQDNVKSDLEGTQSIGG